MRIVYLAGEMSTPIFFTEKLKTKKSILSSSAVVIGALRSKRKYTLT